MSRALTLALRGAPSTRNVARCADLPEVGSGRTLAQGDTREARLSTEGCLALVTIFGLVGRQLGRLSFNCLQDGFQKVPLLLKMRLHHEVDCKLPTFQAFHQSLVSSTE